MKKLLFLALFFIGSLTVSNAQFLTYELNNTSSTVTWDYAMKDAGPSPVVFELGILPLTTRTGVITNFAFPIEFKAQDSNGCGTGQVIPGPTTGVGIPITCNIPTGIKYKVDVLIPFVVWHLELYFG